MKEQKEIIRDSISDLLMENDIDLSSDISILLDEVDSEYEYLKELNK